MNNDMGRVYRCCILGKQIPAIDQSEHPLHEHDISNNARDRSPLHQADFPRHNGRGLELVVESTTVTHSSADW